jgi:hypothetical protein
MVAAQSEQRSQRIGAGEGEGPRAFGAERQLPSAFLEANRRGGLYLEAVAALASSTP